MNNKQFTLFYAFCIVTLLLSCTGKSKYENNMAASFYEHLKMEGCSENSLIYNGWSTIDFEEEISKEDIKKANLSEKDLLNFKQINKKLDILDVQPKNVFEGCAMTDSFKFPGLTYEYLMSIMQDTTLSPSERGDLLVQKEPSNIMFIVAQSVPYFRSDSLLVVLKTAMQKNLKQQPIQLHY